MPAPKGNKFWEARSTHGRAPIFSDPDKLWEACIEYFDWAEENPLWENKVTQYQGEPVDMPVAKMRAMTISGMCLFLDISDETWSLYRKREDFIGVTKKAEQIIYNQKFAGASADLLNANIIARDLGLKDKQELSGDRENPLITKVIASDMDPKEAARLYKEMMASD